MKDTFDLDGYKENRYSNPTFRFTYIYAKENLSAEKTKTSKNTRIPQPNGFKNRPERP